MSTTHTRTHTFVSFANPYLTCDTCGKPTPRWHDAVKCGCDAEAWNDPCRCPAGATSICPSWSPVDGCRCETQHTDPTDTPFGPPDPTPAVERAAKAIVREEGVLEWDGLSERLRDHPRGLARAGLAAALVVEEMAGALLPTMDNWWCGDHVDYHETDDEGQPQPCCIAAREEQARECAVTLRAAILGEEAKTDV